jgi:hypothetical protein
MTTVTRPRTVLLIALAVAALGAVAFVQLASATHVRPSGATPIRVSLVPAYKQCTVPNTQHGPPLAFPSCKPAIQESNYLTVGTPDANRAAAKSNSFELIRTTTPSDVLIDAMITDVRCRPGTAASVCNSPNAADGPDYSGQLQSDATIRITDHQSGPSYDEPATATDIPFPVGFQCANTADSSIGGTCTIQSTALAIGVPQSTVPTRAVVEITQLEVFDGGQDGFIGSAGNTVFMRQGVFIP